MSTPTTFLAWLRETLDADLLADLAPGYPRRIGGLYIGGSRAISVLSRIRIV